MNEIKNIIDTIDNVNDKFSGRLSATEKKLLDEVLNLIKQLNVSNGKIDSSIENLKLVSEIKSKLNKAVLNKDYLKSISELSKGFESIYQAQFAYFQTLQKSLKPDKRYELVKQLSLESTMQGLTRAGIEANVTSKLSDMILKGVTTGSMYADMVKDMTAFLKTDEKSQGALTRYAQTYANTAVNQFAGQVNKTFTEDLGLEWFMYVGSNKETTREFCELLREKEYVHVSEIPDIIKGEIDGHQCKIYERTGLPHGMIEGTTPENFQVNNGGWNCGHKLTPVSEVVVPQVLRDKFKNTQKIGLIGIQENQNLASKNALLSDPLQVNSFLKLVDFMREKAIPKVRKIAFENMIKNEKLSDAKTNNDVYVMRGAKVKDFELHTAEKLSKAGFLVVFQNKGHTKGIKKIENSNDKRSNDVYIYDKKTYVQTKVDLKTVHSGSKETIAQHIISGSGQAPVIAMDIQGGTTRWNLIKGIRSGWGNDTKRILINWKSQWYSLDKNQVFGKYIEEKIK